MTTIMFILDCLIAIFFYLVGFNVGKRYGSLIGNLKKFKIGIGEL